MTRLLTAALLAASALGTPALAEPTWTRCSAGGVGAFLTADVSADGTVLVGSDLSGLYRRSGRADWTRVGSKDGLTATSVEVIRWKPGSRTDALAGTRNGLYRTSDAGVTWSRVSLPLADMTVTALAWKGDVVYVAGAASSGDAEVLLVKSADGGASWTRMRHDIPVKPERRAVKLAMDANDANVVWLLSGHDRLKAGAKELWKSRDGGARFSRMNASDGKPYAAIDVVTEPRIGAVLLMAVSSDPGPGKSDGRGAVYRSVDAGRTWEPCGGLGDVTGALGWGERSNVILVNVQVNACGPSKRSGRFESYDLGAKWTRVDDGSTWDLGWTNCPNARGRAMRTVARTLSPDGSYWVTSQFVWRYAGGPRPKYENAFSAQVGTSPASWITRGIDNAVPVTFAAGGGPGRYFAGYYDIGLWKTADGGAMSAHRCRTS